MTANLCTLDFFFLAIINAYAWDLHQVTALIGGAAVAAAAYAAKYGIRAWQAFKARPPTLRKFYEGGFQPTMTRREAALILGVRYHIAFCIMLESIVF